MKATITTRHYRKLAKAIIECNNEYIDKMSPAEDNYFEDVAFTYFWASALRIFAMGHYVSLDFRYALKTEVDESTVVS